MPGAIVLELRSPRRRRRRARRRSRRCRRARRARRRRPESGSRRKTSPALRSWWSGVGVAVRAAPARRPRRKRNADAANRSSHGNPPFRAENSILSGMPRPVSNPPNPWQSVHAEWLGEPPAAELEVFEEEARSIIAENESPDVGFRYSVNPYRGCFHACAYCYARPTHQYLGWGAGTDFDRKIVVKINAPELLRRELDAHVVEGRHDRLLGRHRLLPAARGRLRADAPLPRGLPRVPQPGRHRHQGRARAARRRTCCAALAREAEVDRLRQHPLRRRPRRAGDRAQRRVARPALRDDRPCSPRPASAPAWRSRRSSRG